jgi:hypothetical protein
MIKKYLKEYIDTWESIFDIKKRTTKVNFNVFVCINFLCILMIYKVSEFSDSQKFINTITILFFVLTFVFGAIKSGVPKITGKIFSKIVLGAFLVGLLNILIVIGREEQDHLGYAILAIVPFCAIFFPLISIIIALLLNCFKKERFEDAELLICFAVLSMTTIMITQFTLNSMK